MKNFDDELAKVEQFLAGELATLRTGRANPALVTGLLVDSYGTPTALKQVAQVTAPNATTIVITPWDKSLLAVIEQAIKASDLGIEPVNDGSAVRLGLPPMTAERRQEMTKVVGEKLEAARVAVRNLRHEAMTALDDKLSEDTLKHEKEKLTKQANDCTAKLEQLAQDKEREILTI